MPTLRPNTVDSHRISFHWPLISLTLFNAPPNSPADFPRSTAIGSEYIPYFHIYFLLSIFLFNFWSHVTYQLCWCSSGCPLESRLPGCPRLLPGRAHRSYATAHLPFTSEAAGSSLSGNFLNATRTQSSCEKSKSQRSAESRGFRPGTPVSSHRES